MKLVTLEWFYVLIGIVLAGVAVSVARDGTHPRRWGSTAFWAVLAVVFAFGQLLPPVVVGYAVVVLVGLAAAGQVRGAAVPASSRGERVQEATRLGNRLFWPALLIPATAVGGTLVLGRVHWGTVWLVDSRHVTLIAVGLGAVIALLVAWRMTGAARGTPLREGSRLLQTMGWALILPQMLAALGGIFAQAGVGEVVAGLAGRVLPTQFPAVAVIAYCVGMAGFTMCMGNAFAAFAVITGGIGLPLIVQQHGGNPAIMGAIGMLSGYCGTLMTPMAANFNLVPALLLELPDRNAVIKAQVPIALVLLLANTLLMWACVYRF